MKLSKHVISIDVGTTNLKMVLFEDYQIIDEKSYRYENILITSVSYQMDMKEILLEIHRGLQAFIIKYNLSSVDIVLTSAMHSLVFLDDMFQIASPVYTWADKNGKESVKTAKDFYAISGTPRHIMNPYFKLKAMIESGQEISKVGSIKDIVFYSLTKEWFIDQACASSSGLINMYQKDWDEDILKELNIHHSQLPVIKPGDFSRPLTGTFNVNMGRVFLGFSDGVSSNGAFANLKDTAVLTVGTSHAVRVITNEPMINKKYKNFCYLFADNQYLVGFPSNNGGNIFEWICGRFNLTFEELIEIVSKRPQLKAIFLPFVYGERAPIWQDAPIYRLISDVETLTIEEQVFAMVCGVMFNIKINVDQLQKQFYFKQLALSGGLSNSLVLTQLLVDILEIPVLIPKSKNIETLGTINLIEKNYPCIDYQLVKPIECIYETGFNYFKNYIELLIK